MTEFVISLGIVTVSHVIGYGICKLHYNHKETQSDLARKEFMHKLSKQTKN